ncbi:Uncharacterised protein [Vibrio cholerae]|nr:Uncharacterised protein [Vibrio cholerae]
MIVGFPALVASPHLASFRYSMLATSPFSFIPSAVPAS